MDDDIQAQAQRAQELGLETKQQADKYFTPTLLKLAAIELKSAHFCQYKEFQEISNQKLGWLINKAVLSKKGFFNQIQIGKKLKGKPQKKRDCLASNNWKYMRLGFGKFSKNFGHNFVIEIWPPGLASGYHHHGQTIGAVQVIQGKLKSESFDLREEGFDYSTLGNPKTGVVQEGDNVLIFPKQDQVHNVTNLLEEEVTLSLHGYTKAQGVVDINFGMIDMKGQNQDKKFHPKCDYCEFVTKSEEGQELGTRLTEEFLNRLIWEEIQQYGNHIPQHCYVCPVCSKGSANYKSEEKYNFVCQDDKCKAKWNMDPIGRKDLDKQSIPQALQNNPNMGLDLQQAIQRSINPSVFSNQQQLHQIPNNQFVQQPLHQIPDEAMESILSGVEEVE